MRGGEVYNLGNPDEYSINHFAKIIIDTIKSESKIEWLPALEDDPQQRRPDVTKANSLGWDPKVSLEDGLAKTIEYFKSTTGSI